ncbi:GLPGLI family protein [Kordia periserrulae]|uniref:GLPGLI family protein n=1 Tax=Kordia periserrulae TaxID=701523 RepID=A0A2T6C3R2_9FLAO|nr:GLPGLI family protein [Kordia periserrulae]PTX62961.1 GLPGLI family protein [Kordia periserrulae]
MQKLFFIFLCFVSFSATAQKDNAKIYKFTYQLVYQSDSTDVYSKQVEDMLLFTNSKESAFLSKNGFERDSIIQELKNNPELAANGINASMFPKTRFNYKIIKHYGKDDFVYYDKIFKDYFMYKESKKSIPWKITTETKTINGFKCQKATTSYAGRDYTAWFSNEIPITDGPYKFYGLPGLIVKISDAKEHYVFELKKKATVAKMPSVVDNSKPIYEVTRATFREKMNEYKENAVERISQSGFTLNDEYKAQVRAKLKKRNNPIELSN